MKHFVYKLIPPRPTFAQNMTEEEGKMMGEHSAYWKNLVDKGIVVIVGPVADPKGVYGLAIVECDDEKTINDIVINDPAIKSATGFKSEIYMMLRATLRK